jgi:membrane protease YdiL (CAAX protease family)
MAGQFQWQLLLVTFAVVAAGVGDFRHVLNSLTPLVAIPYILSGVVTVLFSIALVRGELKNTTPDGAAWVFGKWPNFVKGLAIGVVLAICIHYLTAFLIEYVPYRHVRYKDLDAFDRMPYAPGLGRVLWVIAIVLLGPPTEELLFRGVLYGGYRKSFGPTWATVLTTSIFVAGHLPQILRFPLDALWVAAVALAALGCRLRWNAIGPAIAVHMAYNSIVSFDKIYWISHWRHGH